MIGVRNHRTASDDLAIGNTVLMDGEEYLVDSFEETDDGLVVNLRSPFGGALWPVEVWEQDRMEPMWELV